MLNRARLLEAAASCSPARFPVAWFTGAGAVAYCFHVWHEPILIAISLALPIAALNLLIAWVVSRQIVGILERGPAMWQWITCLIVALLLFSLELRNWSMWTGAALLVLIAWLYIEMKSRDHGSFALGAAGLLLLALVAGSFRLLNVEEQAMFTVRHRWARAAMEAKDRIEWKKKNENNFTLERHGYRLTASLPDDFFLHAATSFASDYEIPAVGRPLASISSSLDDPTLPPSILLFEADPATNAAQWKNSFDVLMGHLVNEAKMQDPRYEGQKEIDDPLIPVRWDGVQWTYTEVSTTRRMRTGVYGAGLFSGRRIVMVYRDPVAKGFRHHPDFARVLRGIKIEILPQR